LRIISAGIHLREWKGKDFIPSVSLALSTALNREKYIRVELSYDEAIRYLQNEAIAMPSGTPRGFILVNYQGIPLGFVKNVGNRANNLYPKEWRIRTRINYELKIGTLNFRNS
jgi:NOL1/NOP2/fmu family ribosome biogenesis protein